MASVELPIGLSDWLASFRARHRRAPRVLHIGNIANNAYNNARLMNAAGLDCDVLCYDYYHAMACPEWEDAELDEPPSHAFRPDWRNVELMGYVRPDWFAQGPVALCVDYLLARRSGDRDRARALWRALGTANRTEPPKPLARLRVAAARATTFARSCFSAPDPRTRIATRLGRRGRPLVGPTLLAVSAARAIETAIASGSGARREAARATRALLERFRKEFPERADQLEQADLRHHEFLRSRWRALLRHYDIVQAYATDPVIPLVAGLPYFAFEHGTLRTIPFDPTPEGRATALAYRLAEHVFVTNHDCLENARLLAGDRVTFINHPFDEDHSVKVGGWQELRDELSRELDADFLIFFPTRHDWVPGTGYADKANDVLLNGFCELRRCGTRVGLVMCEWGANVPQSRSLIRAAGCERHVHWSSPMGIVRFERMARACHVVADQFKLGAFGGVVFKALAAGAVVMTYLNETTVLQQYPELPPVVNVRTTPEIVDAIRALSADRQRLADLGTASRRWMKQYHSATQTVVSQLREYARFLDRAA